VSTALARLDRRLPFGVGTVVAASLACVLTAGTVAASVRASDDEGGAVKAAPTKSSAPRPTTKPTPSPTPIKAVRPVDFLLDVETASPGFTRIADRIAGAGEMGLEDAAEIEAGGEKVTQEDRDALTELGYVRGHSRAWTDNETTIIVFVYEWKTTSGPATFVQGVKAVSDEQHIGWKPPIAKSYGNCIAEGDQVHDSVITAVGKHSFLVVAVRKGDCRAHQAVTRFADLQAKHAVSLKA
jgi:hypothetical protein